MNVWFGIALLLILSVFSYALLFLWLMLSAVAFALAAVLVHRYTWLLARLPVTSMADAPTGLAAFRGRLAVSESINAPVSGKPCQFFTVTIKKTVRQYLGGGPRISTQTVAYVTSQRSFVPFTDGTTQCWLPAAASHWDLPHRTVKTTHDVENLIERLPGLDASQRQALEQPGRWEITEVRARAKDDLCVIGWFSQGVLDGVEPPSVPLPPTFLEMLLGLLRHPLQWFRAPRARQVPSAGRRLHNVLLPDPRFGVLQTPIIGSQSPDALAFAQQTTIVALWCLSAVFAGVGAWIYQYL